MVKMVRNMTWGLLLMAALTVTVTVTAAVPVINAPWGKVEGISVEGDEGRRMNAYLAIPYAEPPVGKLRFERPQPHPGPGAGKVFKADQPMTACPQMKFLIGESRETSEDCLKLDVYVPSTGDDDTDRPYAVMIFIHGGGFSAGDAYTYRPSRLVADGRVIVVVIQYRLGVFGFLTSGDDRLPGNMGLWDQHMAFRWVSDNIAAFGGDPGRVTIFGESAGSMSVGLQMMSPYSQGLFHRGVMQSGAPQGVALFGFFDYTSMFREIADLFQCQGDTTEDLLSCMKDQPQEEFFNKTLEYSQKSPLTTYFFPRIDGDFIPKDLVELSQDEQYMKENGIDKIDLIIGVNNKEGAIVLIYPSFMGVTQEFLFTADFFGTMMDQCLVMKRLRKNAVLRKTVEFYYLGAQMGQNVSKSLDGLVDMYGDCLLTMDILRWAQILAASCHSGARKVYVFDHDFAYNNAGPVPGSHHGDELVLEFDNTRLIEMDSLFLQLNKTGMADEELPLSDKYIRILTTFAKTGNPSPALSEDLGVGQDWPQFTEETQTYLSLAPKSRLVPNMGPYPDRLALWTTFLSDLNTTTADLPEVAPPQPQEQQQEGEEGPPTREEL